MARNNPLLQCMVGRSRHRCVARGKSPYFALFTEMERSGVDWRIRFLSSLFQDGGRHWQHRNQIRSHSAVRGKIISGEGGERPSSLSTDCLQRSVWRRQRGASVLIFRVVAQATCVKLKSTIAPSIDAASEVNLRAISVPDPALQAGAGLRPLSFELVWIATGW